ncbi:Probable 3-hydroxyacyl-CoA dehydrogenase [Ehrlichia ruminantium str. Gardel]|nr:Probable 3-hydroxyacyl-CoA dehydrogenase [Ehrlichia ruminantium str. Gardel]
MEMHKIALIDFTKNSNITEYIINNFNVPIIIVELDNLGNGLQENHLLKVISVNDDLSCLKEVSWIINISDQKKNTDFLYHTYNKVIPYLSDNIIISSNSVFLLDVIESKILNNMYCYNLVITDFFNYNNVIKLIQCALYKKKGEGKVVDVLYSFNCTNLIVCNNTPGLILDRIMSFLLMIVLIGAYDFQIKIEEADFVISNNHIGISNGMFKLLDKMGLDKFITTVQSLVNVLPNDDHLSQLYNMIPKIVFQMISDGYTGSTSNIGGFYRSYELYNGYNNQVIDLYTGLYRSISYINQEFKSVESLFDTNNKYGKFMYYVWSNTLIYIASLVPELSSNISIIDKAVKLTYGWKYGPFEIIDMLNDCNHNKFCFFNSAIECNNLPKILSLKKKMYNNQGQYLNIYDGGYV